MKAYRKYLEPAYGEKAFSVEIPAPEDIDIENPKVWRNKHIPEAAAGILNAVKKTGCYDEIMTVETTDTYLERDGERIPLRLYHPDGEGAFPVLVFYHGGAFMYNTFAVYEYVTRYIAKYAGALVVAVEYRLAPEYRCPVGREDAYAALEWAEAHCGEYGGDASRISVCGDSAGGNFAAGVSLMARDRKGPAIRRQIMIYPVTCFVFEEQPYSEQRYAKGYFLEYNSLEDPLASYFAPDDEEARTDPYNSPLLAENLAGLPEAVFLSAECDPLLDQGLMYAARLEDAKVPVEYHIFEGMIHSFLNYTYEKSFACLDAVCAAVRR